MHTRSEAKAALWLKYNSKFRSLPIQYMVSQFEFKQILLDRYGFVDIVRMTTLQGGFCEEETWLITLQSDVSYVAKLIQYSFNVDHLRTILNFQNYLHTNLRYPCSLLIATLTGELMVALNNNYFIFVQTFLDGHLPMPHELDESYMMKMGALLARWRLASLSFTSTLPNKNSLIREFTSDWWTTQFHHLSLCECLERSEKDYLQKVLVESQNQLYGKIDLLEHGLIHNDFQPSNTLRANVDDQIYLIDFGEASYAPLIVDLATALFLLLTNGIDNDGRLMAFLKSYRQSIELDSSEIALLDCLTRLKLTVNFIGDCVNVKSKQEYNTSPWLQTCSRWIHALHEGKPYLFQTMLCDNMSSKH